MRKTAIKLSKVKVGNGQRLWCVTWPKIGKGRNRQFFKDKTEAATVLQQKLIEQENYGIAGVSFNERHRAEYLECAEALRPFGVTIREAVNFYVPHFQAMKRSCTAAQRDELLKVKEGRCKQALPERFAQRQRSESSTANSRGDHAPKSHGYGASAAKKPENASRLPEIISGAC
jgi:hypothetical protein